MKYQPAFQKRRLLTVNIIFALTALIIEWVGISLNMYVYADNFLTIFNVPVIIIASWIAIGNASWIVYKKFSWIAGLLTGIIIDLPLEFLAFHFGWWTWIPGWSPAVFFNAPIVNFLVYLGVSLGSILTYNHIMKPKL